MSDDELRCVVDELLALPPPPAGELAGLDPELRPALRWGALHHPAAPARRLCLDLLDHLADPEDAPTFVAALADPVPRVRRHAIHALTCEACKDGPWCVDTAGPLRSVVEDDANPTVRFEALRALVRTIDPDRADRLVHELRARRDRAVLDLVARARPGSLPRVLRAAARP